MPRPPSDARTRILDAALHEFAARGFDAATVRSIASRAGVQHGLIRYHFETKENLWFEAVGFLFQRQSEELDFSESDLARIKSGDIAVFRDLLRKYVHYCARHPEHARILMQETVSPTPRMRTAIETHLKETHVTFADIIRSMRGSHIFPADAPAASIMYMITGACQNLFALAPEVEVTLGYKALTKEAIEAHADLIVATFCPKR